MKQRILFLEVLPTISGGQQVLIDLVPGLADYDRHVLLPGPGPLTEALQALGVTCHFASMAQYTLVHKGWGDVARLAADLPRLAWRTARLAHHLDADLIYANSSRAFVWGTPGAALAGRPILWHVHNILADQKSLAIIRLLGRWPVVRRIIAVSEPAASQLPSLADKTAVIPLGIDTQRFRPNKTAGDQVRAELGIPSDAPVVGSIGDLIPLKGQRTLLEAARQGPPNICYLIVGEARPGDAESAAYAAELRALAGGDILFLGRREDIPAVLNALDLLVITSTIETGPRVLLEALACGVPVVSTRVGQAPEVIQDGINGCLYPTGDAAELADKLLGLWSDQAWLAEMGRKAHEMARANFDQQASLAAIEREIEAILS